MKIGIITFWTSTENYGQQLQSYALQQYLRNKGHNPFLIRYEEVPAAEASFKVSNMFKYILHLPLYISFYFQQKTQKHSKKKYNTSTDDSNRHFDSFFKQNISHTTKVYHKGELERDCPEADAYICGSDQIWGGDWEYYLSFVPETKTKIAYAPSLGGITSFEQDYETKLIPLLQRFAFVGMREWSGVEVCHRLGRADAVQVVDPTMLLEKKDYDKLRDNSITPSEKYIFVYLLGNNTDVSVDEIYNYAQVNDLKVIYVAAQDRYDKYPKKNASIGQWIDLIANAELVITNSFHCTVFSLIYNTNFVTIGLVGNYSRMNSRVEELLANSNLSNHLCFKNLDENVAKHVNFDDFKKYRLRESAKSETYLLDSLNK